MNAVCAGAIQVLDEAGEREAGLIGCEGLIGHGGSHHAEGVDGDCAWRLEWKKETRL